MTSAPSPGLPQQRKKKTREVLWFLTMYSHFYSQSTGQKKSHSPNFTSRQAGKYREAHGYQASTNCPWSGQVLALVIYYHITISP